MIAGIGIAVVLIAVIGGYLLEHGNLAVLIQPAEMLIIFGAATGALLISSPSKVVKAVFKSVAHIFKGRTFDKKDYTEALLLLNGIFYKIRQQGLVSIESDVDNPGESSLFSQYPSILKNKHAVDLIADTLRTVMTTTIAPHELDALIDHELDGIELIPFPFQLLAYEYVGIEGGDNQTRAFLMMRTFSPVEKNKMPEG